MTKINDISVSLFSSAKNTKPVAIVNLLTWLTDQTNPACSIVDKVRSGHKELKQLLPAITPSGIFSVRNSNGLVKHSSVICVDIDYAGNESIENFANLKDQLKKILNVAYCSISASAKGYFAIIPIAEPSRHKEHFRALETAFESIGIKIDSSCSDVCRLRFFSYDSEAYINYDAKIFTSLEAEPKKQFTPGTYSGTNKKPIETALAMIKQAQDGKKFNVLRKVSYLLGGYVATGQISEFHAIQALEHAIQSKDNVKDLQAAFTTIRTSIKNGQQKPIENE